MAVSYASIKNNGGMSAQVIACAYGDSPDEGANGAPSNGCKTLYSLDIAGSHTAVKAIWASVLGGSPLKPQGFAHHKVLRADQETDLLVVRRAALPNVHHYHMVVEPKPTAIHMVITSQLDLSCEGVLARFLNTYTLYPVLPEWGEVLFGEGVKARLVTRLETFGLAWAYRVEMLGWDEVLDRAAKRGLLAFPNS
ncbi:MAG: hypothetical protein JW934_19015 [Anaerolineae bacterium]|nr:hypothetical protein [Anaerolineae bacterium]